MSSFSAVGLGSCQRAAVRGLVGGRGRLCFYRRDGREHVYPRATNQSIGLDSLVIKSYTPLKIIGPRVSMLLIGTERTDIAWGIMH